MKLFVFIVNSHSLGKYDLGMLKCDERIILMQELYDIDDVTVRDVINSIPIECIFVGKNLRQGVLSNLMHSLCIKKLSLPEKLNFHWVPPYKMPFEDVDWLYNFGTYTNEDSIPLSEMASNLGVEITEGDDLVNLSKVYFTLIGDFNKLEL